MLSDFTPQPIEPLMQLIRECAADTRAGKLDLGIGVYRNEDGACPVHRTVKAAEGRLVREQESKAYLSPRGNDEFIWAVTGLALAEMDVCSRGIQTPGGAGAVRLALELVRLSGARKVACGMPSWPNHKPMIDACGLECVVFAHANDDYTEVNFDALTGALDKLDKGDAIILHGCCHNPSGRDYTAEQWLEIAVQLKARGLIPIVDMAYHGLASDLERDALGQRILVERLPETIIAYGCDKSFGMYRDRVGALLICAKDQAIADIASDYAESCARTLWSMPPDHGAAVVSIILNDPALRRCWEEDLTDMRQRVAGIRAGLAQYGQVGRASFAALATGNGLFGILPLIKPEITRLRREHAIYMSDSGRINIAGLTLANLPRFSDAIACVQGRDT